jgi:hypothetical protein
VVVTTGLAAALLRPVPPESIGSGRAWSMGAGEGGFEGVGGGSQQDLALRQEVLRVCKVCV